jgi:transposase
METLCRNRRVIGTVECLRCGRAGQDCEGGEISSKPAAQVAFFEALGFALKRIELGEGPLSQWLHAGLKRAGFEAILLDTPHVKAALSAMRMKTDRKDARGLPQLIGIGESPISVN